MFEIMQEAYDLVCLGCGPAGEKAATQAAYFGKRVAVVEREPRPGGAMVNTGTIPSKALRETALVFSALRRRPIPGLGREPRGELSMQSFMARKFLVQQEEHDRIERSFDARGIDVIRGEGRFLDDRTVEVLAPDGSVRRVRARFVLVATGSRPHRPDRVPFDHPAVRDADTVLQLERLPRSMIVVGGGVIGSEYASIFAEIGTRVTLLEPRDVILPFVDEECRAILVDAMRDAGIDVLTGVACDRVAGRDDGSASVTLGDGRELAADVVLWASGRAANTERLNLAAVGLAANRRGQIEVDETFRTSVPSIYAAGDVVGPPALASTSMEQGRVAACRMFDIDFKHAVADVVPFGIYTIPALASVGLGEREAREASRPVVLGRARAADNARARMLGDAHGLLKLLFDPDTRRLLGATIVGSQATETIHLAHAHVVAGGPVDDLINTCFNFPSLHEMYKYAAYDALRHWPR